jgi:formylglycine-generating enzyme required for sulfatase activity
MATIDWIDIPAGTVMLKAGGYLNEDTTVEVAPFAISKYPITNQQYLPFVTAGGYNDSQWWTAAGWAKRQDGRWSEPRYWNDPSYRVDDHPVVGVSWYEAMAFCTWLSEMTGQTISLPTEQQWQRAAQGDDGREYPWGNQPPNDALCNWNRTVDDVSPVTQYPQGASPFGVMDMVGNVWEWTSTGAQTGTHNADADITEPRMLRGGCWSSDSPLSLWVWNRNVGDPNTRRLPDFRDSAFGFRVVRNSVL